jgi:hypothetical protein
MEEIRGSESSIVCDRRRMAEGQDFMSENSSKYVVCRRNVSEAAKQVVKTCAFVYALFGNPQPLAAHSSSFGPSPRFCPVVLSLSSDWSAEKANHSTCRWLKIPLVRRSRCPPGSVSTAMQNMSFHLYLHLASLISGAMMQPNQTILSM